MPKLVSFQGPGQTAPKAAPKTATIATQSGLAETTFGFSNRAQPFPDVSIRAKALADHQDTSARLPGKSLGARLGWTQSPQGMPSTASASSSATATLWQLLQGNATPIFNWLRQTGESLTERFWPQTVALPAQVSKTLQFQTPEQKRWADNIEQYAESPFERALFSLKRHDKAFHISQAWAKAIASTQSITRESALSLLGAYLTYTGQESLQQLSPHTQMKLMLFSTHLNEGLVGRAMLYEALASVPLDALLEFQSALHQDFSKLPSVAQAVVLKAYLRKLRQAEKQNRAKEQDIKAFRQLVKHMVVQFYTSPHDSLGEPLKQQEKIRLGFLKFQPIQQDFAKSLDNIDRQYRIRLRKLKNRKKLKVAEAEEVKYRRIDMIYDTLERDLTEGLEKLELSLEVDTTQLEAV
ncbi:MAG: hypothetical protein KC475_01900 [Cyanobacteria bacterium HKST-UBA03]|nr:hypothetical protein [Cyanobacteria bacterium HKST-UBA03]